MWLLLWQLGAMALNQKILLVSPVQVLARLWQLLPQGDFWSAVGFSFLRITLGFLLACVVGTALGVLPPGSGWCGTCAPPSWPR